MDNIINFFNSNFFGSLSTIVTIGGAIFLYRNQQREHKQQIARLLVNEIRNAENSIRILKERTRGNDLPEIVILPQNNWNTYSHLFTNDFDQDSIQVIKTFYSNAEIANYIVAHGNSMELFLLEVKQRSSAIISKIMDIVDRTPNSDVRGKVDEFTMKTNDSTYHYLPSGYESRLDNYLNKISFILDTPTGEKLKKLAGLR